MDSLKGQLLIAAPMLVDPNFHRTVVLIMEHSEEGALGVVLNRPTELAVGEAVPDLAELADGDPVFAGGPVQPQAVIGSPSTPARWARRPCAGRSRRSRCRTTSRI